MIRLVFLFLLVSINISCKSSDENCPEFLGSNDQAIIAYIPKYIYATESTNSACYAHGLEVIERLNSYVPELNKEDVCGRTILPYYPDQDYKIDTIADKYIVDLENLNAAEVEELTNLVCGRVIGDESFEIQSLDGFEFIHGGVKVMFTADDTAREKLISSQLDSGFNCPLYSFSCHEIFYAH